MKNLPMPSPKGNDPKHHEAVYNAWARTYYNADTPRAAWQRIIGEKPTPAQIIAAGKAHPELYAVLGLSSGAALN